MEDELVNRLMMAVVNYEVEGAVEAAEEALEAGVDPVTAIEEGLARGVRIVGDTFSKSFYLRAFLPFPTGSCM